MEPSAKRPHVFALTGGIGSGKSTVARCFRAAAVPVVDADELARAAVTAGSSGLSAILACFGQEMLAADGTLDRARLGALIFADAAARSTLEGLIHPLIRASAEAEFERLAAAGQQLICYEVPLLFETEQEARYRPVVVVHVPEEAQVARVMRRDLVGEADATARVQAQMDLGHKAEMADYVIDNTGSREETERQALAVIEKIHAAAAGGK